MLSRGCAARHHGGARAHRLDVWTHELRNSRPFIPPTYFPSLYSFFRSHSPVSSHGFLVHEAPPPLLPEGTLRLQSPGVLYRPSRFPHQDRWAVPGRRSRADLLLVAGSGGGREGLGPALADAAASPAGRGEGSVHLRRAHPEDYFRF